MLMKMADLMQGEGGAAKDDVLWDVGVIPGDDYFVKVSKVRGRSRVKATVARSGWEINGSMLLCENICDYLLRSDGLHRSAR